MAAGAAAAAAACRHHPAPAPAPAPAARPARRHAHAGACVHHSRRPGVHPLRAGGGPQGAPWPAHLQARPCLALPPAQLAALLQTTQPSLAPRRRSTRPTRPASTPTRPRSLPHMPPTSPPPHAGGRVRAPPVFLLRDRHVFLPGGGQAEGGAPPVGAPGQGDVRTPPAPRRPAAAALACCRRACLPLWAPARRPAPGGCTGPPASPAPTTHRPNHPQPPPPPPPAPAAGSRPRRSRRCCCARTARPAATA